MKVLDKLELEIKNFTEIGEHIGREESTGSEAASESAVGRVLL